MNIETEERAHLEIARDLYRAFADRDGARLLALLDPAFVGDVSRGMPLGVGGRFEGAETMLQKVWGPTFMTFDVAPVPSELVAVADGRVFAVGHYRGRARKGGPVEAAFVHILSFRGRRVASLLQVTDTAQWCAALTADAPA